MTLQTLETKDYTVTYQNVMPNGTGNDTYIVDTPNEVIADSVKDFSNQQGDAPGEWQYGYYTNPYTSDTFTLMQWDKYFERWGVTFYDYLLVWNNGGHPSPNEWAVRRWVSDYEGEVQVNGILFDGDLRGGYGTNALVLVNGVEVYNQDINSSTELNYQISVNVNVGDVIDLVIDPKSNDWYDSTQFTGIIAKPVGDNPVENPNEGNDKVQASIDYVLPENIENLELLDPAIIGRGNTLPNLITGNSKNNFLVGSFGKDTLNGGLGNDTLVGDGEDNLQGGPGSDTVSYATKSQSLTVNLGNNTAPDTLNSIENVIGTWYDDKITGNAGDNILNPGYNYPNNDFIDGGTGGNDVLQFVGYDKILMTVTYPNSDNNASGKIYSSFDENIVTFENIDRFEIQGTKVADNIIGGNLQDTLSGGKGNDTINGGKGKDILKGGKGNDVLKGGAGADVMQGGLGNDNLTGGLGSDIFGFNSTGEKVDTIKDFVSGGDKIQISATGFGGGLTPGVLNANQFVAGILPGDSDDRFIYNGESLSYDVDGVGSATQIKIATLTGFPVLVASDIVIL